MSGTFSRILCAIDLDGSAPSVLDLAAKVAQPEANVHVLHVVELPLPAEGAPVVIETYRERADVERAAVADLVKKHLSGVNAKWQVEIGDTSHTVVKVARQLTADLVVMATHGRKGFSRFFLGSVAESIMRGLDCPVLIAKYQTVDRSTVAHWMTAHPFSIAPEQPLTKACATMQQHKVRGLPVIEDGKLVGIVTDRDIRNHLLSLDATSIRQAMATSPLTVTPTTPIKEAAQMLSEHKVGALPVLQGDELVGIISTSDLLEALVDSQ